MRVTICLDTDIGDRMRPEGGVYECKAWGPTEALISQAQDRRWCACSKVSVWSDVLSREKGHLPQCLRASDPNCLRAVRRWSSDVLRDVSGVSVEFMPCAIHRYTVAKSTLERPGGR